MEDPTKFTLTRFLIAAGVVAALFVVITVSVHLSGTEQSLPGERDLSKDDAVSLCIDNKQAQFEVINGMAEFDALRYAQAWCTTDGNWRSWK